MSKHQTCPRCHGDFVGPDSHIGENICSGCLSDEREVICEAECLSCGEMVRIYEIGFTVCPYCKSAIAELAVNWEIIEEREDDTDKT